MSDHMKIYSVSRLIVVVVVVSMSLLQFLTEEAYAPSHSFARQTVTDDLDDWSYMSISSIFQFDKEECAEQRNKFNSPDIAAVDYFSDGKSLNTTLWLSSNIQPPIPPAVTSFEMLIDVSSAYDTGQDYLLKIDWDRTSKNWVRTLQDISPSPGKNRIIDAGEYRILENQNYNTTDFYEEGKNYVELNVGLDSVSSPDEYSLLFMASNSFYTEDGYFCNVVDISDRVHVPTPDVIMSMSPSSVVLYPDEQKNIELRLKSSTKLDSYVRLHTNNIDDIKSRFIPNETTISSSGITISQLQIKTAEKAEPRILTLPIFANVTFPTALTNRLSGQMANNSVSASIIKYSNFTVTILKPLTITEQFGKIWDELGAPISGFVSLITAIVGGISTFVIYIFRKKRKDRQNTKNVGSNNKTFRSELN